MKMRVCAKLCARLCRSPRLGVICLHVRISAGEQVWGKQSRSCLSLQIAAQNSPVFLVPFAIPLVPPLVAALLKGSAAPGPGHAPAVGSATLFSNVFQLHSARYPPHPHGRRVPAAFSRN